MEEKLNSILSELQHLHNEQKELMEFQKELLNRTEVLEKSQKKVLTNTKSVNKVRDEFIMGQHQLKIRIDNLENVKDLLLLGQNEIKELIKQTTIYVAGKMSFSERISMEVDLLDDEERQEVINKIHSKTFLRKNHSWAEDWDDPNNDY